MKIKNVTVFGDSVTKGVVLQGERYHILPDSFVTQCAKKLGITINNYSKMGCTISKGLEIMSQHTDELPNSDITLLEYGGNDSDFLWSEIAHNPLTPHNSKTPKSLFYSRYKQMIEQIRSLGSKPVMLSLPLMDAQRFFDFSTRKMDTTERGNVLRWLGGQVERIRNYHDMYNIETFHIAHDLQVPIIDITSLFLGREYDYRQYLCLDGIHPNQQGHNLIASQILNTVRVSPE